jgi:hypothetical protein
VSWRGRHGDQRVIPARIKRYLLPPDGAICFYCGLRFATEIDHVVPVSHGGTSDPENLVAACYVCNHDKSDRSVAEWFADIGSAVQAALLARFTQARPFDDEPAKPRRPVFDELLAKVDTTDEEVCWYWPFEEYRTRTLRRRIYVELRGPVDKSLWLLDCPRDEAISRPHVVGRFGTHYPDKCINPAHQRPVTPKECAAIVQHRKKLWSAQ